MLSAAHDLNLYVWRCCPSGWASLCTKLPIEFTMMRAWFLFCVLLSLIQSPLAISISTGTAQIPLSPHKTHVEPPSNYAAAAILALTAADSNEERHVEIPLRQRIPSGTELPVYLKSMKIVALVNEQGHSAPLEELGKVICRVAPKISNKGRQIFSERRKPAANPWFTAEDGPVQFEADRAVENYECR